MIDGWITIYLGTVNVEIMEAAVPMLPSTIGCCGYGCGSVEESVLLSIVSVKLLYLGKCGRGAERVAK